MTKAPGNQNFKMFSGEPFTEEENRQHRAAVFLRDTATQKHGMTIETRVEEVETKLAKLDILHGLAKIVAAAAPLRNFVLTGAAIGAIGAVLVELGIIP